jgi:hypothetical protein
MPKKITLFSYSKSTSEAKKGSDNEAIAFLKTIKPCNLLVLSAGEESIYAIDNGFTVTVFDDDLEALQGLKLLSDQITYEYGAFFTFAKRMKKNEFACVIDNCFTNRLRRNKIRSFYKEIAKMLATNGMLFTRVLSVDDPYCKEHCPERHWTYIKDKYLNYFNEKQVQYQLHSAGFEDDKYSVEKTESDVYHLVRSRLKIMKL